MVMRLTFELQKSRQRIKLHLFARQLRFVRCPYGLIWRCELARRELIMDRITPGQIRLHHRRLRIQIRALFMLISPDAKTPRDFQDSFTYIRAKRLIF